MTARTVTARTVTARTVTDRTFFGIPVDGIITRPDPRAVQRLLSDLEPLIRPILADDRIVESG